MLFRGSLNKCKVALRAWSDLPWAQMSAMVAVPVVAEAPTPVDSSLFGIVAGLAVIAGISVGVVYRHLQGKNDGLAQRAVNAEVELKTLLTITDDAILVLDADGIIRAVNPAAEEFFGRSADDLSGCEMADVVPQRYPLAEATRHGPASFETMALRKGEGSIPVEIILSPVELAHGRRYLLLTRPRGVAAAAAITEPIRKYCHELNNHLTGVGGNISLVLMNGTPDATTRERVTNAKRAMLKAQDAVRKIQAIAKGKEPDLLPTSAPASPTIVPMPPAPVPVPPIGSGPRVLVLEDEPAIGSLVCGALQSMGCDALAKEDAQAAIEACEEAVKSGRRFDLVISDLSLPGELDGHKAVVRMRAVDSEIKAIVCSGYNHDPIMLDYREHGFSAAIAKPYEMGQLLRLVREVLSGAEKPSRRTA